MILPSWLQQTLVQSVSQNWEQVPESKHKVPLGPLIIRVSLTLDVSRLHGLTT